MVRATGVADSLTVIIFTRDESTKAEPLVSRLETVLDGSDPEIFTLVERRQASADEIWSTVMTASRTVRSMQHSGDVTTAASGPDTVPDLPPARDDWVVVMDVDRLHPAELVPALIRAGQRARADIVVASDSRDRGLVGTSPVASALSRSASGADRLAHQLMPPGRLSDMSDPMRGFFAVRRDSVDPAILSPRREGPVRGTFDRRRYLSIAELPAGGRPPQDALPAPSVRKHRERNAVPGSSPGRTRTPRPWRSVVRAGGFAAVGVTGLLVNSVALWGFVDVLGLGLLLSAALATQVSTAWNFLLVDALVFRGPKTRSTWSRFLGFAVVNNVVLLLRLPLLSWLVYAVGIPYLAANIVSLLAAFAARFVISDRYLFGTRSSHDSHAREADPVRRIGGRHTGTASSGIGTAGNTWPPGGARDRSDGSGLALPA
jgi:dolichol-phosphate mannosyltransferase